MKKNIKPAIAAVAILVCMTIIGIGTAQAQIDLLHQTHQTDSNRLLAVTAPATIGPRHLLLEGNLSWSYNYHNSDVIALDGSMAPAQNIFNMFSGGATLRYGIGKIFELSLGLDGTWGKESHHAGTYLEETILRGFTPSVGMKLYVYEGEGWRPQMAVKASFFQRLWVYDDGTTSPAGNFANPYAGLEFRNRLGRHWVLDYSVGYSRMSNTLGAVAYAHNVSYSLFGRWLPSERLMVSVGVQDGWGIAELRWQASDAMQLKAQASIDGGIGAELGMLQTYAVAGFNWMIK